MSDCRQVTCSLRPQAYQAAEETGGFFYHGLIYREQSVRTPVD